MERFTKTINFSTFEALKQEVDGLVETFPSPKVCVELIPDWDISFEEQKQFHEIEEN